MTDGRERGFIVVHRRVKSWPLWRSMTANQRMVWVEMLLAANWSDSEVWISGSRVTVPRGSFIDTQDTIAREAKVSRKVVRQTYSHLVAEGAISRATVGNEKGHGVCVVTIVNYEKYQGLAQPEGQPRATGWAEGGAAGGPQEGPIQPDQPVNQLTLTSPEAPSAVVLAVTCRDGKQYPVTDAQLDKWREAFPHLDVLGAVRRAVAWLDASPSRRKTYGGMPKFFVSWLGREIPKVAPSEPKKMRPLGAPGALS